jgi:hypothetical protein
MRATSRDQNVIDVDGPVRRFRETEWCKKREELERGDVAVAPFLLFGKMPAAELQERMPPLQGSVVSGCSSARTAENVSMQLALRQVAKEPRHSAGPQATGRHEARV